MPLADQRWCGPGDRIEIIAVTDLNERAQRRDTKLEPAKALVLKRCLGR
jgi:hypothetical protein